MLHGFRQGDRNRLASAQYLSQPQELLLLLGSDPSRHIVIRSGYRLSKDGRLVPCDRHLNVSLRLKRRASKRVRVAKSGQVTG